LTADRRPGGAVALPLRVIRHVVSRRP